MEIFGSESSLFPRMDPAHAAENARADLLLSRLRMSKGLIMNFDFTMDAAAQFLFSDFKIVTDLQAQPNSGACAKIACQSHGSIHRYGALTIHDLADANGSDADIMRQAVLC